MVRNRVPTAGPPSVTIPGLSLPCPERLQEPTQNARSPPLACCRQSSPKSLNHETHETHEKGREKPTGGTPVLPLPLLRSSFGVARRFRFPVRKESASLVCPVAPGRLPWKGPGATPFVVSSGSFHGTRSVPATRG